MARLIKYQTAKRGALFEMTPESINGIEEYIRWAEVEVPRNMGLYLDQLVHYMALYNQGEARKMSFGPLDPYQASPEAAFRTPVRRITQAYYLGWQVRQLRPGVWELFNDSREAYFIEFGISEVGWGANRHVPANRVRRPIRKLTLRRTLEFMMTTQAYHRIWSNIYANPRTRHRGMGFTQYVQGPGAHERWVNVSEHEARGVIRRAVRAGGAQHYRSRVRLSRSGWQVRRQAPSGGTYQGPMLGRRNP